MILLVPYNDFARISPFFEELLDKVKNLAKTRKKTIDIAERKIGKFRKYFQEFKDYKAYLGIAAFSFSDEVLDQASKYGVGIIRQVGEGIEMETQNLKAY